MSFKQTYNHSLKANSQKLRREMTKEERHLWYDFLKTCPYPFHRQKIIGYYIVDFYCDKKKLVVELDGSQHFEEDGQKYDKRRDDYLREQGLTILRYANSDIQDNFVGVCEDILNHLGLMD